MSGPGGYEDRTFASVIRGRQTWVSAVNIATVHTDPCLETADGHNLTAVPTIAFVALPRPFGEPSPGSVLAGSRVPVGAVRPDGIPGECVELAGVPCAGIGDRGHKMVGVRVWPPPVPHERHRKVASPAGTQTSEGGVLEPSGGGRRMTGARCPGRFRVRYTRVWFVEPLNVDVASLSAVFCL